MSIVCRVSYSPHVGYFGDAVQASRIAYALVVTSPFPFSTFAFIFWNWTQKSFGETLMALRMGAQTKTWLDSGGWGFSTKLYFTICRRGRNSEPNLHIRIFSQHCTRFQSAVYCETTQGCDFPAANVPGTFSCRTLSYLYERRKSPRPQPSKIMRVTCLVVSICRSHSFEQGTELWRKGDCIVPNPVRNATRSARTLGVNCVGSANFHLMQNQLVACCTHTHLCI